MSSAPRYNPHYTVSDYQHWEGDWELWNGVAVAMTPSPSFEHQRLATRLTFLLESDLQQQSDCHCVVVHEVDWHIAKDMVVRPDVCVVCEPVEGKFIEKAPSLIAEVLSPSTRDKDTGSKAQLYAQEGVRYYITIDPAESKCNLLELVDGEYAAVTTDGGTHTRLLTLHAGCELKFDLASLLDRASSTSSPPLDSQI